MSYKSILHVNTQTAPGTANTTSFTVTKPTGLAVGDLMIAFVTINNSGISSAPSGWTLFDSDASSVGEAWANYVYYKIATSGDVAASNFTWTAGGSAPCCGGISAYRNVDTTTPINVATQTLGSTTNPVTGPTAVSTAPGLVIHYRSIRRASATKPTFTGSGNERADFGNNGGSTSYVMAWYDDGTTVAAGSNAGISITSSAAPTSNASRTIVLQAESLISSDTGSASESQSVEVSGTSKSSSDTGSATEFLSITTSISGTDTVSATDSQSIGLRAIDYSDDFSNSSASSALFDTQSNVTFGSGVVTFPITSSYNASITHDDTFDFTNRYVFCQPSMPAVGNGSKEFFFQMKVDDNNLFRFLISGSTLYLRKLEGGSQTTVTTVSYNSITHKYWRLREENGSLYWDTSPDGSSWTQQATSSHSFAVTAMRLQFFAGYWGTESASDATLDNVNFVPNADTPISSSDSPSGSETQSLVTAISSSDGGTASETQSLSAAISASETRTSSETQSTSAAISGTETGTGTQSQSVSGSSTPSSSDTGSGTESQSIAVQISSSDTLSGLDSNQTPASTTPSSSDAVTATDSQSVVTPSLTTTDRESTLVLGPGTIWIADYPAVAPVDSAVGIDPDSGVWTDLGGIFGGIELTIDQEYTVIELQQLPDSPIRRLKSRRLSVKTELAETTLRNLSYALNDSSPVSGTGYNSFTPSQDLDSATPLNYKAVLIQGWAPGFKGTRKHKRRTVLMRKCLSIDGVELAYKKDGQTTYTVTWSVHYVDNSTPPFKVTDEA